MSLHEPLTVGEMSQPFDWTYSRPTLGPRLGPAGTQHGRAGLIFIANMLELKQILEFPMKSSLIVLILPCFFPTYTNLVIHRLMENYVGRSLSLLVQGAIIFLAMVFSCFFSF